MTRETGDNIKTWQLSLDEVNYGTDEDDEVHRSFYTLVPIKYNAHP